MADQQRISQEEAFRDGLEGVAEIAERLEPHCKSVADLIGMVRLALDNEGQLKLLMSITLPQQQGKR